MSVKETTAQQVELRRMPIGKTIVRKLTQPPRNLLIKLLIWLYDNRAYHWVVALPLAPLDSLFGLVYKILNLAWPVRYWQEWQSLPEPKFPLPQAEDHVPVKPEACDACGKYLASMIGTYVDADRLSALLPEGLSLDTARIHQGKHPIVLIFGYTQDLHRAFWPFPGMTYLEFLVGIPNIELDDGKKYICRFFYLPVLRLNRFYPTLLGWLVGYRKKWSRVWATENTYSIRSLLTGRKILDAVFTPQGPTPDQVTTDGWKATTDCWKNLLEQPNVNPFGDNQLFLHFHWEWANAKNIEPVTATLRVYEEIPGLSPGTYTFKGIELGQWEDQKAPEGAVRFCSPFELLSPFSRTVLEVHEKRKAAMAAENQGP